MDIARAFTYVFDDEDWVAKLVMMVVWALVSLIPLVGFFGWAALAGYVVQLLRNMQRGDEHPLPRWDDMGQKITDGANVLIAAFVYNLGNLFVICGFALLPAFGVVDPSGASSAADGAMLAIACCLSLILLAYNLVIWPLLAVGTAYYSRSRQINAFFQLGRIYSTINRHMGLTIQWMIFSILVSIVLGLINGVPCIGWLVSLGLTVPVQGHLLGQYALQIADKPKNKPKRVQVRP